MTLPAGYERLLLGHAIAVARADLAPHVRAALVAPDGKKTTLYEYASQHPAAMTLTGRGAAYAVSLPRSAERVVVRHNRHGGLFAGLTRDLFIAPTRAPRELAISLVLRDRAVPTPEIVAYAVYPPGSLVQRSDVCTREIPAGRDLADILQHDHGDARTVAFGAAADLVAILSRAAAWHRDLNAKNILISSGRAFVLDVDRVSLNHNPSTALDGNLARLSRSLRKWRDHQGAIISESEIARLESEARRRLR